MTCPPSPQSASSRHATTPRSEARIEKRRERAVSSGFPRARDRPQWLRWLQRDMRMAGVAQCESVILFYSLLIWMFGPDRWGNS